jgi:phosphoribosyl 1,2-cyclic phosphodiesterase
MQRTSGRSPYLIDRIMGGNGHLSNEQALDLAMEVDRAHPLGTVVLLHLSRQCNCPSIVERLWAGRAPALATRLVVSGQHAPTRPVDVAARAEHATLFDA